MLVNGDPRSMGKGAVGVYTEHDYLTTAEVAHLLRTSPESVRYWRHIGKGPQSFRVGRRVLYARRDVDAFLADMREKGSRETVSSEH